MLIIPVPDNEMKNTMYVHVICPLLVVIVYCYLKFKVSLWGNFYGIVLVLVLAGLSFLF